MRFSHSRQLHLAGLFAALAVVGCGSGGKRPGPVGGAGGSGTSGYASFTWRVFDVTGAEYQYACSDLGIGTMTVTLTDAADRSFPTANVLCDSKQMSTVPVPTGDYSVHFEVFGDPVVYGNTTTKLDDFYITDDYGNIAAFPIGPGLNDYRLDYAVVVLRSFVVGWSFASGPASALCARLGASYVDLDFLTSASTTAVTTRFPCADGQGLSFPYPYGPSSAQWQLVLVDGANAEITKIAGTSVALPPLTGEPADVSLGNWVFNY
jgi:hypothetical protein